MVKCVRKKRPKEDRALNVITKLISKMQKDLQNDYKEENSETEDKDLPHLMVYHFSFEKLHQVMIQNNNQILGAYHELTQYYNMLDHYKSNSTMPRKTLHALNGGAAWKRDFKGEWKAAWYNFSNQQKL